MRDYSDIKDENERLFAMHADQFVSDAYKVGVPIEALSDDMWSQLMLLWLEGRQRGRNECIDAMKSYGEKNRFEIVSKIDKVIASGILKPLIKMERQNEP